jgi:hypothetical protein
VILSLVVNKSEKRDEGQHLPPSSSRGILG